MKHNVKATAILLGIFLITQLFGIGVIMQYIDQDQSTADETVFKDLPIGDRPDLDEKTSFLPIIIIILVGTLILLLIIKFKAFIIWKLWFLIAVLATIFFSVGAFIEMKIALAIALVLALWKVFKPNPYVHNFTEILVYAGLAAIFVPLFSMWSIIILLLLISVYDAYAVWKSKHMITLAKAQSKAAVFAGLMIPYTWKKPAKTKTTKTKGKKKVPKKVSKIRTAILGGGDIGFPLIFTGVVLKEFNLYTNFYPVLIIPLFTTIALALLFYYGDKNKFYPAMPFLSLACFLALGAIYLISFFA